MGKAGGLIDNRANPGAVAVYRMESRTSPPGSACRSRSGRRRHPGHLPLQPARFRGFFLASQFPVHNEDVLYIGNAAS